jgi:polyhydroxyalkanoate synthesis regulator phasin
MVKTKKPSMRNTPANKVRRIRRDIERCTAAMLGLEMKIEILNKDAQSHEEDNSEVPELQKRVDSLRRHIKGLEEVKSAWKSGGSRSNR